MKKFKKNLVIVFAIIMLINIMAPCSVVHAASTNQITISIPERDFSSTYKAYDGSKTADNNAITLYVNQEDFPVYATISSEHGSEQCYTFSSYGTKKLEVTNNSGGFLAFQLFTFPFTGLMEPPHTYATIIITAPKEATDKPSDAKAESDSATPESNSDSQLQPLIDKMIFTSGWFNADLQEWYRRDVEDFMSGTWDGTMKSNVDDFFGILSSRDIVFREYRWTGFSNTKVYQNVNINIDYIGNLPIETGNLFTLAFSNSAIEKWEFLEMTDSWKIPVENESIESVLPALNPTEDGFQGNVFTIDEEGNQHLYILYPDGEMLKAN